MYCISCGTKIDGKFCPNCGAEAGKENKRDVAFLNVKRPNDFLGSMFSMSLYVDDKAFTLTNGESINICLVPGMHVIRYNMVGVSEKRVELVAEVGKQYSLEFDFELINGYVVSNRSVLK